MKDHRDTIDVDDDNTFLVHCEDGDGDGDGRLAVLCLSQCKHGLLASGAEDQTACVWRVNTEQQSKSPLIRIKHDSYGKTGGEWR